MLFGKKKKKLDARVRFQHSTFTKKLGEARNYKRTARTVPESKSGALLYSLGLRTWWSKFLALIIIAGVGYLAFFPNFLFVKTITVSGADGELHDHIMAVTRQYFATAPFYDPRGNMVLMRPGHLANLLRQKDSRILSVKNIDRSWFKRALTIEVEPKHIAFVLNRAATGTTYSVYNDGTVKQIEAIDSTQWLNLYPGTLKISDGRTDQLQPDQKFSNDAILNLVTYINEQFKQITTQDVRYVDIPQTDRELPVIIRINVHKNVPNLPEAIADYAVIIDPKSNLETVFNKVALLLSQTAPDRYRALKYIDMRLPEKGFVCLVNAPCATEPVEPVLQSTNNENQSSNEKPDEKPKEEPKE